MHLCRQTLSHPDPCYGAQRHPVPLDAFDVDLRGQRLLDYGERLCQEETGEQSQCVLATL